MPQIKNCIKSGDVIIIAPDHGNDAAYEGTDHTLEQVPVLVFRPDIKPENLGERKTYADIGQSIAAYLKIEPLAYGESFL